MKLLLLLTLIFTGCATQKATFFYCEHEGKLKPCSFKADSGRIAIQVHE